LDHFLLITCDFLPQKDLELICSTRLSSNPGSATDAREKKLNNLVDIVGKPRVQITIIEDVAAGTNIARTTLLAATMKKSLRLIWRSKI
jgi:hypothetical protein